MSQIYISPDTAIGLPLSITDPTEITGATEHSIVVGGAGGQLLSLGVAGDGFFPIGSAGADPVLATITSGRDLEVNPDAGIIEMRLNDNTHETAVHGWNGGILETADVYVFSDGINVAMAVEKDGGGNLTVVFSDGFYDWVTAPDSVALTPGTDVAPTINYVYFLQSTKVLTASTVGWPATEHAPLATVLCQSAASVQTKGAYKVHAWTDHVVSTNEQGHLAHLNYWIREQHATWMSGVAQTLTITPNGGAPDDVIFTNTAGTCLQLHPHTFPAFAGTPDLYTVNDSVTPYNIITDLNELLLDSTGASMAGKYFSLVVWGVISEDTADCKLMVNLPGGSYNTQAALEADSQNYVNYSMPTNFKGTGFLIYQMDLRHQVAASGTWTSIQSFDLRGQFPSTAAGSSTAFATEFADNVFRIFDDGDNTKKIAFQADQISVGTVRTITMDDRDIDMDAVPDTIVSDAGNCTPAAGSFSIVGAGSVSTSAIGSVFTVTGGLSIARVNVTTATQAIAVDTEYTTNYGAGVCAYTLPATAAIGEIIEIVGYSANGYSIAQNAGQTIHFLGLDTTTGIGGSVSPTTRYDCIKLKCTVVDTDFVVMTVVGNFTIV